MRLTTADDRRKGFWIAFVLAMIALASFGSALLVGCAPTTMRKLIAPIAIACSLALAGCVTSGLSTASALLPLITTSLDAACASSQALASQAAAQPALSGSSTLAKVNSKIASVCGRIDPASAQAGTALNALNTLTAALLGAAGAAGINLPGLK